MPRYSAKAVGPVRIVVLLALVSNNWLAMMKNKKTFIPVYIVESNLPEWRSKISPGSLEMLQYNIWQQMVDSMKS